ncbi:MAG: site-specific DNA-methyltransferase, partial [Clostridia bacterium]|nr:site-specific DNA-methyltransferase [Clostridia bacterium]
EYILMERKPGGYRKPTDIQREASKINKEDYQNWFTQIWKMPGASTRNGHPAPFPLELAMRLVKMFSFVGDTVLDPFSGSGTTMLASINCDRNSVGVETEEYYCKSTMQRLENARDIFLEFEVSYVDITHEKDYTVEDTD